mgnify:CR=1 FL=1
MGTPLAELAGTNLGAHTATYDDTAAILYALAVGASATDLDLVYERDLRTLPTYACALGLWAVEAAGRLGAYDPKRALHASQRLVVHEPLPPSGDIAMTGTIGNVWDKTKAAIVEIGVSSDYFTATYNIFLPGRGGWGGDRGPSATPAEPLRPTHKSSVSTSPDLAALYRLTGDRHPVHVDSAVAEANGHAGAHPADLVELDVRLAAPVLPGDTLDITSDVADAEVRFETSTGGTNVLAGGRARFAARD